MENLNIFQRMAAITAELQTVSKNLVVSTGASSYKAVSERDVLDAVKPLETKYGVYSYPASRTILESNMLESEKTYNGKTTKRTDFMTRIQTVYRFVNVDKPDEYIEITAFAEGLDSGDKGSGKAMTYSDKYALMKAYKISTGDDPDQTASEDALYNKRGKRAYTRTSSEPVAQSTASKTEELIQIGALRLEIDQLAQELGFDTEYLDRLAVKNCGCEYEALNKGQLAGLLQFLSGKKK